MVLNVDAYFWKIACMFFNGTKHKLCDGFNHVKVYIKGIMDKCVALSR